MNLLVNGKGKNQDVVPGSHCPVTQVDECDTGHCRTVTRKDPESIHLPLVDRR
ncbi:unnamed protein product [Onchocerca flexuosa]|uniref:DUF2158 domain-containing protein n=1 Tax=Onchocerca flexuosa TaxID=387005 RepID=A0A183I8P5_9BILA|nr:unnamed protein product [Onchocerca flexuosa]